jgi:hypothetical protein
MSRRIDVELTSARDDGSWTWRAAGAKQPKGVLDGSLLYPGAKVGDVVRCEADFEIEGINVISVMPPKTEVRKEPERIEIIGTTRDTPGVTSSLVPKNERPRGGRDRDRGDRPERGDRPRGDRRPPRERTERPERPPRERAERPPRERPDRPERPKREERPAPPKPKRLSPANVHRAAVMESLAPEQRPIAEQVLRGGIPAVRQAVEQQNAGRAEGEPEVRPEALIAMAEELLPRLKAADWRDRAEAAVKDVDEIALRDLRSVVAGADQARDDESRDLARTLRESLERRLNKERESWVAEITTNLDEGRVVRALRLSARPPDPGSRFPAELALRLAEAAGAAMSPDITPDRWSTVLDAVAGSPVRRSVKPAGMPADPGEALLQAAKQASGRVPALAAMLGIDMPPPPGPPRGAPPRPPKPRPQRPPKPKPAVEAAKPEADDDATGEAIPPPAPAEPTTDAPPDDDATGEAIPPAPEAAAAEAPPNGDAAAEPAPPADAAPEAPADSDAT